MPLKIDILKNDDYNIVLLEKVNCTSRDELTAREQYHIKNNKCVNKVIAGRSLEEWKEENRQKLKDYQTNYRNEHKGALIDYHKEYKSTHRQEYNKYNSKYRAIDRDILNEKRREQCHCQVCGGTYTRVNKSRHEKMKHHQEALLSQNNIKTKMKTSITKTTPQSKYYMNTL
ncbi:MAG: hypothetical protein EOO43_14155 [Flavobacterium sp.]|nr:MAG: hypothetical protein EOO43_14155 [Flavobacterium sp.]